MPVTLTNAYCALADLKLAVGITDTNDDDLLSRAINSASREVDHFCGRRFWKDAAPVTRVYHAASPVLCETDDIATATGLVVSIDLQGQGVYGVSLTVGQDFILEPLNSFLEIPVKPAEELHIVPFAQMFFPTFWRPGVQVTATFGWPATPDDVAQATIIQATSIFKAKDAPFGIASFGDMPGGLRVGRSMNPFAADLLRDYAKPAVG